MGSHPVCLSIVARRHRRHLGRAERDHLPPGPDQAHRPLRRETEPEVRRRRPPERVQPPAEVGRAEESHLPKVRAEERATGELRQEQELRGRLRARKPRQEPR